MKWHIGLAKQANSFINTNHISREQIFDLVASAVRNFQGEKINIDIKKMKGQYEGFYRIRKGKWRMIVAFNFDTNSAYIESIDWRGNVY